jgi:hypothetical protein
LSTNIWRYVVRERELGCSLGGAGPSKFVAFTFQPLANPR